MMMAGAPKYRRQYQESLDAVEHVLRLIDAILADASPLLGLDEEDPRRQIEQLREAKVALSILGHFLRKGVEDTSPPKR